MVGVVGTAMGDVEIVKGDDPGKEGSVTKDVPAAVTRKVDCSSEGPKGGDAMALFRIHLVESKDDP